MNLEELSLIDRVTLYLLPSLLASDIRKTSSSKTIIHEARLIAETFLASANLDTDQPD